jgi:hypothetical protein
VPNVLTTDSGADISPDKQTHILDGNFNKKGMATGAHNPNSPNIRIDQTSIKQDASGNGVFTAKVEIKDANGNFVPKGNSSKDIGGPPYSTFFPTSWSPAKILTEINIVAAKVPNDGKPHTFPSPSGVFITITKDKSGKIVQAFPASPQKRVSK